MPIPAGFPLYPSSNFKTYNVSLALPGPMLWDIPSIGSFAQKLGYPNAKTSIASPDTDYIAKFATYNIGISDFMLKSSLDSNLAKIPAESIAVREHFVKIFEMNTQDNMGIKAIEKSILSSIFESQKPFFEIARLSSGSVIQTEDIIARISPLFGAAIVGPERALSVKSRKPVGNGPIISGRIDGIGRYNVPPAIGFKGGVEIKSKLSKFKNIAKKGNDVKLDREGNAQIIKNNIGSTDGYGNSNFMYATISTVYSTGEFDPSVNYIYKYVDIDPEPEIIEDSSEDEPKYSDYRPERIILGIFDANGNSINPRDKIKFWDVAPNGELVKSDSIFEKASWIYQTEKWIFNKSIENSNTTSWKILGEENFHWKRWIPETGEIVQQHDSPGEGWEKMRYKDVMNFNSEENRIYKFKENEYIITFSESTTNEYINYYNDMSDLEISRSEIDPEDRNEIKEQLKQIYTPKAILDQLQSLTNLSKLKISYYNGTEIDDWERYQFGENRQTAPSYSDFNNSLRRTFKPMKFSIGGKDIWIDPETDYDYKIIRVDSSPRVQYKQPSENNPNEDVIKTSYISEFIKNKLLIKVSDSEKSKIIEKKFSLEVYKNGTIVESLNNITEYVLINWNFEFDNTNFVKKDQNEFRFKVFLPGDNPPNHILEMVAQSNTRHKIEVDGDTAYTAPRSSYENTIGSSKEFWSVFSSIPTGTEIISSSVTKVNNDYYHIYYLYKYFYDIRNNPDKIAEAEDLEEQGGLDNLARAIILRIEAKEEFKRYEFEPLIKSGVFTLKPLDNLKFREIQIEVESNKILSWIIYDEVVSKLTKFRGSNFLPGGFKSNQINFNLLSDNFNNSEKSGDLDINLITDLPKFQAKLSENDKNKIIDSTNITNDRLITNDAYSTGEYGMGFRGDETEPDSPIKVGYLRRNQLTELDVETFYIIEAVKEESNTRSLDPSSSSSAGGFYRLPHALGIVPSTIKLVTSISTKLIPAIKKMIKLIKNPSSFLTEIVQSKSEEFFTIFKPSSIKIMNSLPKMSQIVKSAKTESQKEIALLNMRNAVKNSEIGNFVYVDEIGGYKFLLDGTSLIGFFGLLFGIKLDITKNQPPIKPIFSKSSNNLDFFIKKFQIKKIDQEDLIDGIFSSKENIENYSFNEDDSKPTNKIQSQVGNKQSGEEISIEYSTGKFIKGVDYKYIYVNQEISKILLEADEVVSQNLSSETDLDGIEKAIAKYEEAYDLVDKTDSKNESLKKSILDKIESAKSKHNLVSQPIFKLILGIVSLPLKIVFEIIKWMLDFFKKLTNPAKIPEQMKEFLSFSWIMNFFTPKGIFEMAGIKFNPEKVAQWCVLSKTKKSGSNEYLLPDDYPLADLNQFLSVSFEAKLPLYNAGQYRDLCLKPFRQFSPLLCLFERIINGFIMLIWSVMGITAIIPPPLIKICSRINENINIEDFNSILNGLFNDISSGGSSGDNATTNFNNESGDGYTFVYEVKLPDGSLKRNLGRESIEKFIEDNDDLDFQFSNFETIQ